MSWIYQLLSQLSSWLSALSAIGWFAGFLSGVAATVLGFIFTMVWEMHKSRRESRTRDDTIRRCIFEDFRTNKVMASVLIHRLREELKLLPEQKMNTDPLTTFRLGFWDLAKLNLSPNLLIGDRLEFLRNVVVTGDILNQQIQTRETYRLHNQLHDNFPEVMVELNNMLIQNSTMLLSQMNKYEEEIQRSQSRFSKLFFWKKQVEEEITPGNK